VNDYSGTINMRVHEMLNSWNYFHKPRLIAEMKGLPAKVSLTWSAIVFQLQMAALLAILSWVTKRLNTITEEAN
jgi:hypothetical protein